MLGADCGTTLQGDNSYKVICALKVLGPNKAFTGTPKVNT